MHVKVIRQIGPVDFGVVLSIRHVEVKLFLAIGPLVINASRSIALLLFSIWLAKVKRWVLFGRQFYFALSL